MDAVVAPLSQSTEPPDAVKVTAVPAQLVVGPLIVPATTDFNATVCVVVAVHPLALVIITL